MADAIAEDMLKSLVRRIESVEDEIKALNGDKSEIYKEARGSGFDVKVLRKIVADRRKDSTERNEFQAIYDLYWNAIHGVARAHVEIIEEFDAETDETLDHEPLPPNTAAQEDGGNAGTMKGSSGRTEPSADGQTNSANFDRSTGAIVVTTGGDGGMGQVADVEVPPVTATSEKVEDGRKDSNAPAPSSDGGPIPGAAGSIAPRTNSPATVTKPGTGERPTGPNSAGERLIHAAREMRDIARGDATPAMVTNFDPRQLRPHCLHPECCGGYGRNHCGACQRAAANASVPA